VIICIGIGGSYLGAKAVLEAMSDSFKFLHKKRTEPVVVFAGQNISEDYTHELLEAVKEYSIATIVISKSGTTTEPAIAFRLIKAEIEKRYGKQEAAERIVAITDKARGALKTLADNEGYPTFVIPDDVGGRFSVLTPVGLLPLAAAGVDIAALVRGAQEMERLHPNVTALFGRVKMAGEIDLIANLDCVVSMDSLVMHLASLVATPVVSVWGATHPGLGFFGYGCDPRGIVQADMECRPCSVFGNKPCRYGDYRCLHAVTPAMIVERVEEIVGK